jgi:hypothetical protein
VIYLIYEKIRNNDKLEKKNRNIYGEKIGKVKDKNRKLEGGLGREGRVV